MSEYSFLPMAYDFLSKTTRYTVISFSARNPLTAFTATLSATSLGKPYAPRRNKGERNALAPICLRRFERIYVAKRKLFALAFFCIKRVKPLRSYGMYHVFARKIISARDLCLADAAFAESPALLRKSFACGTVNASVRPSSAEKPTVRRVHYGVNVHFRYVISYDLQGQAITSSNIIEICINIILHRFNVRVNTVFSHFWKKLHFAFGKKAPPRLQDTVEECGLHLFANYFAASRITFPTFSLRRRTSCALSAFSSGKRA